MSEDQPQGQLLIYEDGGLNLQVRLDGSTVWLTQAAMAALYQTTLQNITTHIKSIYDDGELAESATCKDYLQVQTEGGRQVRRALKHYSLDMILAIGYRVRSHRGTQFRQWATSRLKELLINGFTLDDERIKAGRTAAELIRQRADAAKPNMGLTAWKNAPGGPVRKGDVKVAKNYLTEAEMRELNRVVTMYLDYAEDNARRGKVMHMADWEAKLNAFLQFNERNILNHAGKVSHELAMEHVHTEFTKFDTERRPVRRSLGEGGAREDAELVSDFDKQVKQLEKQSLEKPKPRKLGEQEPGAPATGSEAPATDKRHKRKKRGQG